MAQGEGPVPVYTKGMTAISFVTCENGCGPCHAFTLTRGTNNSRAYALRKRTTQTQCFKCGNATPDAGNMSPY